jgi:hypothetical protein
MNLIIIICLVFAMVLPNVIQHDKVAAETGIVNAASQQLSGFKLLYLSNSLQNS